MLAAATLDALGDITAQKLTARRAVEAGEPEPAFDFARTVRCTIYGLLIYPPIYHHHLNFLEWLVVKKLRVSTPRMPFVKAAIEQFGYWGVGSNMLYHASLGAMQGMTLTQIDARIRDCIVDTMLAQWAFWVPAQIINFKFVPVRHQLNFVLALSYGWTTFLSLAFPPAKLEKSKDKSAIGSSTEAAA